MDSRVPAAAAASSRAHKSLGWRAAAGGASACKVQPVDTTDLRAWLLGEQRTSGHCHQMQADGTPTTNHVVYSTKGLHNVPQGIKLVSATRRSASYRLLSVAGRWHEWPLTERSKTEWPLNECIGYGTKIEELQSIGWPTIEWPSTGYHWCHINQLGIIWVSSWVSLMPE